ncbi:MAG: FliO/MopB family protein [Candidatus Oleimicrobiaceae bacterium]
MRWLLWHKPRGMLFVGAGVILVAAVAVVALQTPSLRGGAVDGDLRLAEGPAPGANTGELLVRTLLGLGILVAVIFLGVYGIRRLAGRMGAGAPSQLRLLGCTFLGPKRSLCAVLALDRVLIVGVTDAQITLLTEITDQEKVEAFTASSKSVTGGRPFVAHLEALLKGQHGHAS